MSLDTLTSPAAPGSPPMRLRRLVVVSTPGTIAIPYAQLPEAGRPAPQLAIGREPPDGGLRLPDREVSRVHARVDASGEVVTIDDAGSRNGVFVDGAKVPRAALAHGSVIRIGASLLVYVDVEVPPGIPLTAASAKLLGDSLAMQRVRGEIVLAAPRPVPVLILGETGVGKERVAEELHRQSGRRGPLIAVNGAAIPTGVAESELFGRVAGAFTGATASEGLVAAAHHGTLFLDEVGELPPEVQAKLLRVLATGEVRPVGSANARHYDVRVIAATRRDLEAMGDDAFRADLFARLAGWIVRVPPLRTRREDILRLAAATLAAAGVTAGLTTAAAEALLLHDWPLNVRELEQTLRQAAILAAGGAIDRHHLPAALQRAVAATGNAAASAPVPAPSAVTPLPAVDPTRTPSRDELQQVLDYHAGNVAAVARFFGKDRRQIYRWIERLGLQVTEPPEE